MSGPSSAVAGVGAVIALAAGAILIALVARGGNGWQLGAAIVFGGSLLLLYVASTLYHATRHPVARGRLKVFDHCAIYLLIAGTYTPYTILLLDSSDARILLSLVWFGAITGVLFRVFWLSAPRWLYVPIYLGLGWAATFWLPSFGSRGGAVVLTLIIVGGLLYSAGAVVYGLKRPDPSPRWFGFHEIFHACTLAGFLTHHVGVWLAAFGVGTSVAV